MRIVPRITRWLAVVACVSLTQARVLADDQDTEPSPEVKAKCTTFLQRVIAAQRKGLDARMATEIDDVAKVTTLAPEGIRTLRQAAVAAEDAAQADLLAKALGPYAKAYAKNNGKGLDRLDRAELVEAFARPNSGFDQSIRYTRALDQAVWKDALAKALTPAQAALWQKSLEDKIGTVAKEFDALLDKQAVATRTSVSSPILAKSAEIIDALALPKDRADAVIDLAKQAVDASMDTWRREARRVFLSNDEEIRAQILRAARPVPAPSIEEDAPENQPVWTRGIARLLSDDDRAKLRASHGTQRQRRTRALASILMTLMDEKVAFTAAQRPRLEPIMAHLVETVTEFYPQNQNNRDYFNLQPVSFYKAAAGANPEEVRSILDDSQWKHWQEAAAGKRTVNPGDGDDDDATPAPSPDGKTVIEEPEDLEHFVSDYIQDKVEIQHRDLDAAMLLQVEDAVRVATLPPEVAARLRTAALGTAEITLAAWSGAVEQSVRAQVQGATRETVRQRLGSSNRYYYGQAQPKEQGIWQQTLKSTLTQTQQDAWQVERDARTRFSDAAIAQFLLAEFDRRFSLSAEQWERLAPPVVRAVHDYRPDINRIFSYNSPQWYLTSYYMFMPLHAIPEAECKAVIGKERYDRWVASSGFRYTVQYWDNLRDSHERRLKEEKP